MPRSTNTPSAAAVKAAALVEHQLRAIERGGGDGEVALGRGTVLKVSSLNKLFFPATGATKGSLMRYYTRISPYLLSHLKDRALILKRYPDGVDGPMFFQQTPGGSLPDGVETCTLDTEDDGPKARLIGGSLATLLYTVQLGAIETHAWMSRVGSLDTPDFSLIDLDPGDDVSFADTVSLARDVLGLAEQCELPAAVKTSGSSGIHIVFPLPARATYETSARLAELMAEAVRAHRPTLATTERSIRARPAHSIYVDAMQNARGKSMATAYSVRATPAATVSAPLSPRELTARLRMEKFTIATVTGRAVRGGDAWGAALAGRPTVRAVERAMTALEQVVRAGAAPAHTPARRGRRSGSGGAGGGATGGRR